MCGPIRSLTEARGYDTTKHHLASFGGAGGQHACAIAELLGIRKVLIHKHSSILSAYGIGLADVVQEGQRPCAKAYDAVNLHTILADLEDLSQATKDMLGNDGILNVDVERFLNMRYDGSETTIMIAVDPGHKMLQSFVDAHHQQFGFTPTDRQVFVDSIRVRVVGRGSFEPPSHPSPNISTPVPAKQAADYATPQSTSSVYFDQIGWTDTPVCILNSIPLGTKLQGPALVVDETQTILVGPGSSATSELDKLVLDISNEKGRIVAADTIDPVQLSVFRHRFMSVAEQMGRVLQQVSVSANIKERLDFSCAVFSPDGSLVANAPHVPAMIGSMAFAVRGQIEVWRGKLKAGDVLLSNAPGAYAPMEVIYALLICYVQSLVVLIFRTSLLSHLFLMPEERT